MRPKLVKMRPKLVKMRPKWATVGVQWATVGLQWVYSGPQWGLVDPDPYHGWAPLIDPPHYPGTTTATTLHGTVLSMLRVTQASSPGFFRIQSKSLNTEIV